MTSVPETADEKRAKLSDANAARTAAGAGADGLMVLSLVSRIYKPVKELWSVNKALDPEVPRDVHISVEVPVDVRTRLLHQHERKSNGQHHFPVESVFLGGPAIWDGEDSDSEDEPLSDVVDIVRRDPSVAIALTMLPPSLKYLGFAPHYNLPIEFTPGSVIKKLVFGKKFDHEIDLRHVRGLETVLFGKRFNHTVHFPTGVKEIRFGECFNKRVDLPRGLVAAYFGVWFDQEVVLPEDLATLELDCHFNQDLELPSSLKELRICSSYFNKVLSLPDGLEYLTLGSAFNSPLSLPPSLRRLWFIPFSKFNQPLVGLPAGLEALTLGYLFNHPLQDLPAGLERLEFNDMAEQFEGVPHSQYNQPTTLPAGLKYAKFGYSFNQPIELNDALEEVQFGHSFDQDLTIPARLATLTAPLHYSHDKLIIQKGGGPRTWKRECTDKKAVYRFISSESAP